MRKLLTVGLAAVMAGTLLTGCVKMDGSVTVNNDGSCVLDAVINVEKDILLKAYTSILNGDGTGGYNEEQAAVMLEMAGIKLVTVDNKEYYQISSDMAGNGEEVKYDSILDFYRNITALVHQDENNLLSLSETSVVIKTPSGTDIIAGSLAGGSGNIMDSIGSLFNGGMNGADADVGNAISGLLADKDIIESLKSATVTYNISFASKIREASSNVVLSEDGKSMSVTMPLLPDKSYNEYAYCENDIAATGALNGITYNNAVTVSIPDGVKALLNGKEVTGNSIKCDKTGTYNFKLEARDGTKETLCFMVDTSAPVIARQKNVGKTVFQDFYIGKQAILNNGYIAVYDIESGVSSISVNGNNVLQDATMNIASNKDQNSLAGSYFIYSLNTKDFDEGSYMMVTADSSGNESGEEFIIDRTAPSIKGVKNKKTYKKAVTIKFSDKNGIKSAKLNGKAFKSGSKVSKKGNYTLKVTDNAGNSRTVKFQIKKA